MKRLVILVCLAISCLCFSIPAGAKTNNSVYAQSRAQRKAEKKQQKAQKKYAKAQRKAQKRMIKKDRKNTKMYPPHS